MLCVMHDRSSTPRPSAQRAARRARPARRAHPALGAALVALVALVACGGGEKGPQDSGGTQAQPQPLPQPTVAARVADLLGRMTLDEKLGQMTMIDRKFLQSPADLATWGLGALCSGGGSPPDTNTPQGWADMVDGYQRAALSSRLAIPLLYGADAVHGHGDVYGATLFPQNIGLGAARDPALVQQVARATAEEMAATGVLWNFAPDVGVIRDVRSGRTFESFGELPEIATSYDTYVTGLQGAALGAAPASVLATAKHWIADGATTGAGQYGDAPISDAELRTTYIPPFAAAIQAGAGTVMIAHNSLNGTPMHANGPLITDVLKKGLGFGGFVVSDWAGTADVWTDYATAVRTVVNSGIDMVLVPDDYRGFIATLRGEVTAGRVPMSRIDDAVTRILTKKVELGLFERPFADRSLLPGVGGAAHRDLARRAVRASLVLLKNDGALLPLPKAGRRIFVAGKSADDIGNQSGGWTIHWQGASGDLVPGTTILRAIRAAVAPGTTVGYARDGSGIDGSYDVAIAVVGEKPYAEDVGDVDVAPGLDDEDRATLARLASAGVPTVVVLVTGRPLIVTDQLPGWRALLVAWLPGTEGEGVTDVLFGDAAPTGKLPITWPRTASQVPIHMGSQPYDPLFPYGFGLGYGGR
jgi:beta-glucosidase